MPKYLVIKNFTDKYDKKKKYKIGEELDITTERAKEILSVDKLIKKITEKKANKEAEE